MKNGEVVKLADVHKTYHTGDVDVHAVRGVSLEIKRGEFVALMGASGSGKSTLMNILACLDRPTSGQYFLDNADVSGLDRDQLADIRNRKIGFVFQNFNLLPRTSARENAELPLVYSTQHLSHAQLREKADRVLASVGLAGREDHPPSQLSGGQQQRVAIARALINDPEVLLADEPTGNLDSRTSVEVMGIFQSLNDKGITIIMVTHEADIASYARRNVVMKDGLVRNDNLVQNRLNAMVSIGNGAKAQVEAQIAGLGENIILIFSGSTTASGIRTGWGGAGTLKVEDAEAIRREVPQVTLVSEEVVSTSQVAAGNQNWFTRIYGESADYFDLRQWSLADGAPFTQQDVRSANKVCVVGRTTATQIYGSEDVIGQVLRVKNVPFQILGVLTS